MDHNLHSRGMSLNRLAASATIHCLTGCAIGEILGMSLGTALGWGNLITIAVSVALAFVFGYSLTLIPLLKSLSPAVALRLALAADTLSIVIMETVDNLIMLVIPGAMAAGPTKALFWSSLALSLVLAGLAAYPANRWLIARGKGHAVVHGAHSRPMHSAEKPSVGPEHKHAGHHGRMPGHGKS